MAAKAHKTFLFDNSGAMYISCKSYWYTVDMWTFSIGSDASEVHLSILRSGFINTTSEGELVENVEYMLLISGNKSDFDIQSLKSHFHEILAVSNAAHLISNSGLMDGSSSQKLGYTVVLDSLTAKLSNGSNTDALIQTLRKIWLDVLGKLIHILMLYTMLGQIKNISRSERILEKRTTLIICI